MKPYILLSVLLFAGFSITSQAQTGLFIDYTQSGWFLILNGATPNTTHNYTMIQSAGSGQITFSLTENGTYSNPLNISVTTDANGNGQTLYYVKGTTLGPATWQWCTPDLITCGGDNPFSVVTISSLEYQAIDSPLDTNPNAGGGNRIYPDKTTPTDNTNRKRVRVKATLSAAINNLNVFFKSFDLDDPSAGAGAVDPNDTNGSTGDDNRATTDKSGILSAVNQTGTTNTLTVATNSSGIAEADFTVTMNPGDNFMAAASGDPNIVSGIQIDGITLKDSNNNTLPISKAKNSSMLTVWRKIHLEVDNMGILGTNHQSGTIPSASVSGGQTFINLSTSVESGRYVPGKITIGNKTYDVLSNTATQVVVNQSLNLNQITGKSFTLYDDDDYDSDGAWQGDENESTIGSLNALTKMQTSDSSSSNVYAPAYIMPIYDGGGNTNNNGSATGYVNIEDANAQSRVNSHRGSAGNGSNEFWVGYFLVGYQGALLQDLDPVGELNAAKLGITETDSSDSVAADCTGLVAGGTGSIIYQETQRDIFAAISQSNDNLTAPHELGHQFGLQGDAAGWGIMGDSPGIATFEPAHLHMLRCRVKSPGL